MEMFCPDTPFLWQYMVSCGALQWPWNIRWCWCTPMCHWLLDITLSSNDVCLSTGESPCNHYLLMHWTSLYRAPGYQALDTRPCLAPSDIWWPSMETRSILFTWGHPTGTDIWWPLKHIWLACGWYTSYWNVFLLLSVGSFPPLYPDLNTDF